MQEKVAPKIKAYATFFEMMGDSFVYESEYLRFHWAIGELQGVIKLVPHITFHVPKFTD